MARQLFDMLPSNHFTVGDLIPWLTLALVAVTLVFNPLDCAASLRRRRRHGGAA